MMTLVAPGNQWPPHERVPVFRKDARMRLWVGFCDRESMIVVVIVIAICFWVNEQIN
jgi:hypothetical protein